MGARKKQRSIQQIMEDTSLVLLKQVLPEEWVIHEYKPDFGIDFVVEIFNYVDKEKKIAETLGELFFVQLKSVAKTAKKKIKVYARNNVELGPLRQDKNDCKEVEVIPFSIETSELLTVQSMGAGTPVLLLLAVLDLHKVFFVCLNDFIDKIILLEDQNYAEKGQKTIYIPLANQITTNALSLLPLRFYAKRSKLYAAFNKFSYQLNSLQSISLGTENKTELQKMLLHFIAILKSFDFWETTEMWVVIGEMYQVLLEMEKKLLEPEQDLYQVTETSLLIWQRLTYLSTTYEEICREWFLPTYLTQLLLNN